MAEQVNIIEELFADSGSEGEKNFEGFNYEDFTNVDKTNYDFVDEQLWNEGDRHPYPLNYKELPGLQCEVRDTDSPIEIFELFLKDTVSCEIFS